MESIPVFEFWDRVQSELKTKLPPVIYNKIIPNIFPVDLESNVLTLMVMDPYLRSSIENNTIISNAFTHAVSTISNQMHVGPVRVTFNSMEAASPADTSTPSSSNQDQQAPVNDPPAPLIYPSTTTETQTVNETEPLSPGKTATAEPLPEHLHRPIYTDDVYVMTDKKPNVLTNANLPEEDSLFSESTPTAPSSSEPTNSTAIHLQEPIESIKESKLNHNYTFETFIHDYSNRIAYNAAERVADNPGGIATYNPLFIYGESGLGKTHLMHAIGNRILQLHPTMKVMCITSENFLNVFISYIRSNKGEAFRNIFRSVDVLMIDDIQFITDKRYSTTQREFFHNFNDLISDNKQIVLTSDTIPDNFEQIEDRLRTRFKSGLVTHIDPPGQETLEAILLSYIDSQKEIFHNLHVAREVITYMASLYNKRSIRELKGGANQLLTSADLENRLDSIDIEFARKALSDVIVDDNRPVLSISYIQEFISDYFKIKKEMLLSQKRNKQYAFPRQLAMYLCRELVNESYPDIAKAFGKKDHTTSLHAYEKISREYNDPTSETHRLLTEIINQIKESV
ncbi:MAG: chromosomal replication initiator protein DnaA [Veillonellaceae bacterium]|nr:chromosomal replication initiator protein DnaA [Veillonellaceae bacterium]